ncbi:LysM domain-containing protein [Apiospora marii]|uniref:LysM domain-containing protein n=1 Tax=Apiospora marii TaxID=335849 RepID=A0ABR1SQ89_9PEZI
MLALSFLTVLGLCASSLGYTIDPPTTAPSDTLQDCTNWYVGVSSDKCDAIANDNFITLEQLYRYNPSLAANCDIKNGISYCVEENFGIPPPLPPTTTSTSAGSTTTAGNGISTPTPTMGGMVSNCNKFYFVPADTSCSTVLSVNGITLEQLFAWNADVGVDCRGLWAKVYVCVGVIGGGGGTTTPTTPTTTLITTTTTTSAGNGIATPSPTQPGMVSNCDKFYFVPPDTPCNAVLSANGITLAQLYAWNAGVGDDCRGLWARVYVCVHAIGAPTATPTTKPTATTTRTTTTAGNGIATPTPSMPNMVSNCKRFYKVASGDDCTVISSKQGVTVANIIKWNPETGSSCNVWLGYYICIGV